MPKQSDDLTRKGDEKQKTPKADLTIPVPPEKAFKDLLGKASKKRAEGKPAK